MPSLLDPPVIAALVFAACVVAAAWLVARARDGRLLRCPESGAVGWVEVEARKIGAAAVRRCDLWPAQPACTQGCLARYRETAGSTRLDEPRSC